MSQGKKTIYHTAFAPLLFIALLFLFFSSPVQAQSAEWKVAIESAVKLYKEGRYEEAIPFYEKVIPLVEEEFGPDHPEMAVALNNLALLNMEQGRYAEVELQVSKASGVFFKLAL